MRAPILCLLTLALAASATAQQPAAPAIVKRPAAQPIFHLQEVMIPMRDGVRLQTILLIPEDQHESLPILLTRTPYGVPAQPPATLPFYMQQLAQDGYIFVFQNLRGRFKSEGVFHLSSQVDLTDPKATNETTDAYDTIDWLVKNVKNNNGKVGMIGVSYAGLTAALALLNPHPALKAISEQASPVDQWMNDDMHRFGALRESYAFEYSVLEQADKNKNTNFDFDIYDTFQWYLGLGPLANINADYLHNSIPFWNDIVAHPNYDEFWRKEAWVQQLHASTVPNLNVAGFWDQEDPWGPWQIFEHANQSDPNHTNFIVAGPWYHGGWHRSQGDRLGTLIPLGGHKTSQEFSQDIEAPFFRFYLHGTGSKPTWQASTFQTGSNTWHTYPAWPPKSVATNVYFNADGTLTFSAPSSTEKPFREFTSDPANPVPYRQRPISPTYPGGDWRTWESADQRFVDNRPDVLTYVSAPLDHDITITGQLAADLYASTSGTDSDLIVKLIDVYPQNAQDNAWAPETGPQPGQYAQSINGYELPIAMEVRRGRFLKSFDHPQALVPNQRQIWSVPLRDHDHVFLKNHRIMVQVQSTWFPIIDRNPQMFVPSIYEAKPGDFVKSTQRIYSTPAQPSHLILPVVQSAF